VPDQLTLKKDKGGSYDPHPEGQFVVQCVDMIDLGERVDSYQGRTKIVHKVALVFVSDELNDETGQPFLLSREFSVSLFAKSNLRQFLEGWRGKKYEDGQLEEDGLPLHKLVGQVGLATIAHNVSQQGRTYANLQSLVPLPKKLPAPDFPAYERPGYYTERKAQYAAEVEAHRAANAPPKSKIAPAGPGLERHVPVFEDIPDALLDDDSSDDLPF